MCNNVYRNLTREYKMIIYSNEKTTPNQLAKNLVMDMGENASYLDSASLLEYEKLTEREIELILEAVEKQTERVRKFLNL